MTKPTNSHPTEGRTLNALRTIVWDEIEKLRSGQTTAANVCAISNATGKILSSIKLEMEYVKLIGRKPNIDGILGELPEANAGH